MIKNVLAVLGVVYIMEHTYHWSKKRADEEARRAALQREIDEQHGRVVALFRKEIHEYSRGAVGSDE